MLYEQFQNSIEKSYKETKLIPLTYKYMIAHFPGLEQAHGRVKLILWAQTHWY